MTNPLYNYVVQSTELLYTSANTSKVVVAALNLELLPGAEDVFEGRRSIVVKWCPYNPQEILANEALGSQPGIMKYLGGIHGNFSLPDILPQVGDEAIYERLRASTNAKTCISHRRGYINSELRLSSPPTDGLPKETILFFERVDGCLEDNGYVKTCSDEMIKHIFVQLNETLTRMRQIGWRHKDLRPRNVFVMTNGTETRYLIGDLGKAQRISPNTSFTDELAAFRRSVSTLRMPLPFTGRSLGLTRRLVFKRPTGITKRSRMGLRHKSKITK